MAGSAGDTLTTLQNGVQAINNLTNKITTAFSSIPQATTPGGSSGQVQFNNSGSFGGLTIGGDATLNSTNGNLTIASNAVTYGKIQQESASTLLGNLTGSSGAVAEQPSSAVTNFLQTFSTGHQGVVTASTVASGAVYLGGDNLFHTYTTPGTVYLGTVTTISSQIVDTSTTSNIIAANNTLYRSFLFIVKNIVTAVNAQTVTLQIHSTGGFQNTSYIATMFQGFTATAASNTAGIQMTNSGGAPNSSPGFAGFIHVANLGSTTDKKIFTGNTGVSGTNYIPVIYGGYWNGGTGVIDGFQIVPGTSGITSGNVDIYGLL